MALVKSGSLGSGPSMAYELHADETGGSGNSRTIKVTFKAKVNASTSASFYGYPATWRPTVNSKNGSTSEFKSSARWYGGESFRSFTQTITVDVGTTDSKSIAVSTLIDNPSGGNWAGTISGNFTVSATNTAPTWPSGAELVVRENNSSGRVLSNASTATNSENAVKVSEGLANVYLAWTAANDDKTGVKYTVRTQKNNGSWYDIYNGTGRSYTHAIGSGSSTQGDMWDYYVFATDSDGVKTSNIDSRQFQKNVLTGAAFGTKPGTLGYSTSNTTHAINWSGASNTDGSAISKYELSCSQVSIFNGSLGTSTSTTLTVWNESGNAPTGPYIKRSDLISFVSGSANKTGTLTFRMRTFNSAGSYKDNTTSVAVDMKTTPTAPGSVSITGKTTVGGTGYIIPSVAQPSATWTAGSDPLGGGVVYQVEVAVGTGSYQIVGETSGLSMTLSLPTVSTATTVKVKVSTKTTYGNVSGREITDTIHYWNPPTITFGKATRTTNSFSIPVTTAINSSLNLSFSTRQYVGKSGQAVNFGTSPYTINETGLTDTDSYTITVTVRDNSGLSSTGTVSTTRVSAVKPVLSVREKGVGVGAIPDGSAALIVSGSVNPIHSAQSNPAYNQGGHGLSIRMSNQGEGDAKGLPDQYTTGLTVRSNENRQFEIAADNTGASMWFRAGHVNNTGGQNTGWSPWRRVMGIASGPYDGLMSAGSDQNWLRTTKNGIIPYDQAKQSTLGTSGWRFKEAWVDKIGVGSASVSFSSGLFVESSNFIVKRTDKPSDYDTVIASREADIDLRNINDEGMRIFARQDGTMLNSGLYDIQGSRTYFRYTRDNKTGSDSSIELRGHNFTFTADRVGSSTIKILEANYVDENAHFVALGGGGFTHIFGGERQKYEGTVIAEGSTVTYGLSSEDLLLSANRYVYLQWDDNSGPTTDRGIMGFGSAFQPTGKSVLNLGTSGYRFATIYAVNALNTSDSSYKENIRCLTGKTNLMRAFSLDTEEEPTAEAIADFMLTTPLYSFDYKNMKEGASQYGIMADELKDSPVAKRFVYDLEEGSMISTQSYASALHITIQEQQKQINQLQELLLAQGEMILALQSELQTLKGV